MIVFFFYQLDAQIIYFSTFIIFLYMFRALLCLSSGGQIVLVQHLVSSLSLGDCSVHRLREDCPLLTCVLNSHLKRVMIPDAVLIQYTLVTCVLNSHLETVTIPDAILIQFVFLKISIILLETCREI